MPRINEFPAIPTIPYPRGSHCVFKLCDHESYLSEDSSGISATRKSMHFKFWKILPDCFPKMLVLVYSPISNVWESLSFHNLTNTVYYYRFPSTCFQVFISAQLISENLLKPFQFSFFSYPLEIFYSSWFIRALCILKKWV